MPAQLDQLWDAIREELRRDTSAFKFHIWLEPLELAGLEGLTLYVRAPEHIRTSVSERYLPLLRRAAASTFDTRATVEIVGADWTAAPATRRRSQAAGAAGPRRPAGALNPKYTFEQFVIGEGNRFAHAAALAVAELPSHSYNPLFLIGSPGIGKTHLLHAIGNYIQRFGGGPHVRYATIEEFTAEFVDAVRARRTSGFKEGFRSADVLLIDDVQFLAGRTKTREEFFHTFNALLGNGRQLVMTSDRSPEEIPELEERLIERFCAGLVVELDRPGVAVRRAILATRARLDGVDVTPEVVDEIAVRVATSVRALEGALIRVVAYASLKGEPPTPDLVRHVLRRLGEDTGSETCGIPEILDATAREFGVERAALLARDRRPAVASARHVAMFLARELTDHNLTEIGGRRGRTQARDGAPRARPRRRRDAHRPGTFRALSTTSAVNSGAPRDVRLDWKNPQLPRRPRARSGSGFQPDVDVSTPPNTSRKR